MRLKYSILWEYVAVYAWVLKLDFHVFIFFPLHSNSPTQNNTPNLQEYIINFPSEMAAASYDKCSLHPIFFPLFIFIFHFLQCTWDTNTLSLLPLCAPDPLSSRLHGHNDMSHSILDIDSHTYRHGLNIIPCLLCSEYIGKQQTYIKTQIQIHPWATAIQCYLTLNQFKIECWSSCLQMAKKRSPSLFLFSILSPPSPSALYLRVCF